MTEGELVTTSSSGVVAGKGKPPHRRLAPLAGSLWVQAGASGLLVALLMHLRYGYLAGERDHVVLSPVGLGWAHPDWFDGDWAMNAAPQPHYLFDAFTWLGEATGTLAGLYLIYWLAAMATFGLATALLARRWAGPGRQWSALLLVTVLASVTPIYLYGSGGTLAATALPGVLGGMLVYLTGAALLVDRHRIAAIAAVAAAVIHVQQGAITAVLCAGVAGSIWLRSRRIDWRLLGAAVASVAIVVIGLQVRPVAGHLEDFAEACRLLIPYHCDATAWGRDTTVAGAALILLALATVAYVGRDARDRWFVVVMLPAVGMLAAAAADRWNVPVLGVLVQGLNVYRLAVILLPLAVWGALVPLLADLPGRRRLIWLAITGLLGLVALADPAWGLVPSSAFAGGIWMVGFGLLFVAAALLRWREGGHRLWTGALAAMALCVLLSAFDAGAMRWRPFDARLMPDDDLRLWGAAAQQIVAPGGVLLIPPQADRLRLATRRAVVVDCKYGPYGGQPWQEFKERLTAVGGIEQCLAGSDAYDRLTGADLAAAARRYGAGFVVVNSQSGDQIAGLEALGAQPLVAAEGTATYVLLRLTETG